MNLFEVLENVNVTAPKKRVSHEDLILDKEGFVFLSKFLLDRTGIFMDPSEKSYSLMSNRMHKILKKYNCSTYLEFIKVLENGSEIATNDFLEVLTTNTTNFFRENEHFIFLKKNLHLIEEYLIAKRRTELRIWCAAASSGEEPYTILITLLEHMSMKAKFTIKMIATDLNTQVLLKAKEGIYKSDIADHISADLMLKYRIKQKV